MPDIQYYTGNYFNATTAQLIAQTEWIVKYRDSLNIVAVFQLGDCTENGDRIGLDIEYKRADSAFSLLEDPKTTHLKDGIPFSISIGNHDQWPHGDPNGTTKFYNQVFGEERFAGRGYYGGHYGKNNDNHFLLFSSGSFDYLAISMEYDLTGNPDVIMWADSLLKANTNRQGIIMSHYLLNPNRSFGRQGYAIYERLRSNPNLFLMLCGHFSNESRRTDAFAGNFIHTLLADYQFRENGGNGWMRILVFLPEKKRIKVYTFSPSLGLYEEDPNSQFILKYDFEKGGN